MNLPQLMFNKGLTITISAHEKTLVLSTQTAEPLDLSAHLPFRVAVVSNLLALNRDQNIRSIADLEPREMRVLLVIGSYMPIKSADIAYKSRIDSSNVSRAVKVLLDKKLISAASDPKSRNIKYLCLTDSGTDLYSKLVDELDPRAKILESVLTDDEKENFYRCLAKVEAKAEEILAQQALTFVNQGLEVPADQKEILRWYKKSNLK